MQAGTQAGRTRCALCDDVLGGAPPYKRAKRHRTHLGVGGSRVAQHAPHVRGALLRCVFQLPRMPHLPAGREGEQG